jgi:hypothetical protein
MATNDESLKLSALRLSFVERRNWQAVRWSHLDSSFSSIMERRYAFANDGTGAKRELLVAELGAWRCWVLTEW